MKRVVIFSKDDYDAIGYIVRDAFECACHCPESFYTNEVIDKLKQVLKILKEEDKDE